MSRETFFAQYFNKKIVQYLIILRHRKKSKVSSENNVTYPELRVYLGQKKPVAQKHFFFNKKILCVTWV